MGVFFLAQRFTDKMFNKDFGKSASDLLNQGFPDTFEFDVSSDSKHVNFSTSGSMNEDGSFDMTASPSITCSKFEGTTFDITLDTNGSHNFKLTNKNGLYKGLKSFLSLDCQQEVKEGSIVHSQSGSLGFDYVFGTTTISTKFAFPCLTALSVPKSTLGLVYQYDKYAFGFEGVVSSKKTVEAEKLTGNFQMRVNNSSTVSVGVTAAKGKVDANVKYLLRRPEFIFATQVDFDVKSQDYSAAIAFGKTFAAGGVGKVTLSTNPEIGLSYKKEICDDFTLTVGTKVPLGTFQHKTGVSVD